MSVDLISNPGCQECKSAAPYLSVIANNITKLKFLKLTALFYVLINDNTNIYTTTNQDDNKIKKSVTVMSIQVATPVPITKVCNFNTI